MYIVVRFLSSSLFLEKDLKVRAIESSLYPNLNESSTSSIQLMILSALRAPPHPILGGTESVIPASYQAEA
jgi:hypothetical protein